MYHFPLYDCTEEQNGNHTSLPSVENANDRLRQEPDILLTW